MSNQARDTGVSVVLNDASFDALRASRKDVKIDQAYSISDSMFGKGIDVLRWREFLLIACEGAPVGVLNGEFADTFIGAAQDSRIVQPVAGTIEDGGSTDALKLVTVSATFQLFRATPIEQPRESSAPFERPPAQVPADDILLPSAVVEVIPADTKVLPADTTVLPGPDEVAP